MKVSMPIPQSPTLPAYREEMLKFIEENLFEEETQSTTSTTTISTTTTTESTTTTTYALTTEADGSLELIDDQGNRALLSCLVSL